MATALRPALLFALVSGACAVLAPAPEVSGPCTVVTFYELDGEAARIPLSWPYIVMGRQSSGVSVFIGGAGWQTVDFTITDAMGAITHIDDVEAHAGSFVGRTALPGVTRYRLQDNAAGCTYEVGVEVRR
jgi:hypothetical protein